MVKTNDDLLTNPNDRHVIFTEKIYYREKRKENRYEMEAIHETLKSSD